MARRCTSDPRLAVGFLRVSSQEQGESGLGLEGQRAAIESWAAREGVVVVAWFDEVGVSGGAPLDRRPRLLAALDELRARRAGLLVAAKRDRLARDVVIAAAIERIAERAGARVVTTDGVGAGDGPEAALLRTLVDAFAQYERALIRSRTKVALAAKRARGERAGAVPFGFELDPADEARQRLRECLTERDVLATIRELRRGGMTIRGIVRELGRRGVPCRGKEWHVATVHALLQRSE